MMSNNKIEAKTQVIDKCDWGLTPSGGRILVWPHSGHEMVRDKLEHVTRDVKRESNTFLLTLEWSSTNKRYKMCEDREEARKGFIVNVPDDWWDLPWAWRMPGDTVCRSGGCWWQKVSSAGDCSAHCHTPPCLSQPRMICCVLKYLR